MYVWVYGGLVSDQGPQAGQAHLHVHLNPSSPFPLGLQVRYKEEFEKNKGKGFSVVADTPELQRIKKTQDQISNVRPCPDAQATLCPPFSSSP